MFNTSTYNKTVVSNHVNAVTGNITKTYAKSFFKRFHLNSEFAGRVLCDKPSIKTGDYNSKRVQVIQMIICGDMEVIAELIFQKDYEELFETENKKEV